MPLESKAQARWMFATHPEMAKRWAAETPDIKALPEKKTKDWAAVKKENHAKRRG